MQTKSSAGFTLVEILIVAPIIILFIGVFVGLIVELTGNTLQMRASNEASYQVQAALDEMQESAATSIGFLSNTGPLTSPLGKNNTSAAFVNSENQRPDTLIVKATATTKNPLDPTAQVVYSGSGSCNSQNPAYSYVTVYMVRNKTLYKRTILDRAAACQTPWQRNSCAENYVSSYASCQVADQKLLENIDDIDIAYYADASSTQPLAANLAATAKAISVSITLASTVNAEPVTYTGSAKMSNSNIDPAYTQTPAATGTITANASSTNPYTTNFVWEKAGNATSYSVRYRPSSSTGWTTTTINVTNPSQATYSLSTNSTRRQEVAQIEITANTPSGSFVYGTASRTMPNWNDCEYTNGWGDYGAAWPRARYTKTSGDVVMLDGLVAGGGVGTTICVLPPAFRPDSRLILNAQMYAGASAARIDITTAGEVIVQAGTGATTWVNLSGLKFLPSSFDVYGNGTTGILPRTLTGANNWVSYGSPYSVPKLMLDSMGRGHIQGLAKNGSTTAYITAFTGIGASPYTQPSNSSNIFPAIHTGNAATGFQLNSTEIITRNNTLNSFWSLQGMFYTNSASWINASLQNSWVNYGGNYANASYIKSSDGIVSLQGLVRNGAATGGTTLFTLPAGYRPVYRTMCSVTTNPTAPARIDIQTTGAVTVHEGVNNGWLSLAGCDFLTD